MGKKTKKDLSRGKETLVSFYGLAKAKKNHNDLIKNSKRSFKPFWN